MTRKQRMKEKRLLHADQREKEISNGKSNVLRDWQFGIVADEMSDL